jgi:glutamate carboxypeptidase
MVILTADEAGRRGEYVAVAVRDRLEPRRDEMVDILREFVAVESGSNDREGLAQMADRLEARFGALGRIARYPIGPEGASHLVVTVDAADPRPPGHTVVLGHYDTVWERGTLARMPFAVNEAGVATGPGGFDMKGGLVLLYWALAALRWLDQPPRRPVRMVFNCDEELGSPTSRRLITTVAIDAVAALVLESPLPGGALKTARKGSRLYRVEVKGRSAHSGIEPEKGASAIVEMAHQIQAIEGLSDPPAGTTVNVGIVRGGSRINVVPGHAEAEVAARVATAAEADRLDTAMSALRPVDPRTTVRVIPVLSRPPLERTDAGGRLFDRARAIAEAMGVPDLAEGTAGGASDGNLVAAMGIPTLDGLGPHGGGAHAEDEHVDTQSLPHRAALLAGLLAEL